MSFVPTKYLNFQQNIERNSSFEYENTKVSKLARSAWSHIHRFPQCQCFVGILSFIAPYNNTKELHWSYMYDDVTSILRPEKIYIFLRGSLASLARTYYVTCGESFFCWYICGALAPPPPPPPAYQKAGYATGGASCSFMVSNWL